jgi:hypothetical protein
MVGINRGIRVSIGVKKGLERGEQVFFNDLRAKILSWKE